MTAARICLFFSVGTYTMAMWQKPEWFHEIFGHWDVSPMINNVNTFSFCFLLFIINIVNVFIYLYYG